MKKIFLFSILSFLFTLFLYKLPVEAYDVVLDQSQTEGGAAIVVYKEYYRNQTFKVTKNVITQIEVFLKNRHQGDTVTLQLKNETTGWPLVTLNKRMGSGDGWESFDLYTEDLTIYLDKEDTYSMWIGTAYYSENATAWYYSDTDVYPYGQRRSGTTPVSGDHAFKVYGFDIVMERDNSEEEANPVDNTQEDTTPVDNTEETTPIDNTPVVNTQEQVDNTSEESTKDISEETAIPDKPISKIEINETDIDDNIVVPSLEFIIIDNFVVEPKEDEVNANKDSVIKIVGIAGQQDDIFLTIGNKTYTAKADENGNWYIIVSATDLEGNTLSVSAMAQNEEGMVSNKEELFKLNIQEQGETVITSNNEEDNSNMLAKIIYIISAVLILIIAIVFIYLKKKKKEGNVNTKSNEPDLNKTNKV